MVMPDRSSLAYRAALLLLFLATTWNCGGNAATSNSNSMGGAGGNEATANAGGSGGKGASGPSGTPGTPGTAQGCCPPSSYLSSPGVSGEGPFEEGTFCCYIVTQICG
jgi:hypothetical protein